MFCTLHIDTRISYGELVSLVATVTNGTLKNDSVFPTWGKVGVGDDLRTRVAKEPDDFLNWPYYLDTYIGSATSEEEFINGIYQLRNGLVEHGVRVWIVTDLEHIFPAGWTPDG